MFQKHDVFALPLCATLTYHLKTSSTSVRSPNKAHVYRKMPDTSVIPRATKNHDPVTFRHVRLHSHNTQSFSLSQLFFLPNELTSRFFCGVQSRSTAELPIKHAVHFLTGRGVGSQVDHVASWCRDARKTTWNSPKLKNASNWAQSVKMHVSAYGKGETPVQKDFGRKEKESMKFDANKKDFSWAKREWLVFWVSWGEVGMKSKRYDRA